jgi:RNA polymerase sigma-70 factor (ECF subfamily)
MAEQNYLAEQFEAHRAHLRAVAYRMLGSRAEAEDAVQEAWLRLSRAETDGIGNLGGWLTTVVARLCLDMLRARKSRREEPLTRHVPEPAAGPADSERDALLADSVGLALLVVLDKLAPAERVAFVLHDMFDLPFEEIAAIVGRSPATTRQLASRARRRVRGGTAADADTDRQRDLIDAFLAASRNGDLAGIIAVLAPDVVFRGDAAAVRLGGAAELRGASAVAETFKGRAQAARTALIDGAPGIAVAPRGRLLLVLALTMADDKIVAIEAIADPKRLQSLDLFVFEE